MHIKIKGVPDPPDKSNFMYQEEFLRNGLQRTLMIVSRDGYAISVSLLFITWA